MMIRSFLPVGQGAFYVESFKFGDEKVNVVYDCGSSTNLSLLKREIENNFHKGETINAVFISHLHNDHINGLKYLIDYCDVKNIFLPFVTEENKKYILLEYLIQSKKHSQQDFVYKFIQNPFNYASIMMVTENESFMQNYNNDAFVQSGKNVFENIFKTQSIESTNWEYVPYNLHQENGLKSFKLYLEDKYNINIQNIKLEDMCYNRTFLDKFKKAYNEVKGSLNSNSMVLFSGVRNNNIIQYPYVRMYPGKNCCQCCDNSATYSGCLYMGDYDAKSDSNWDELIRHLKSYIKYIGCVQIPHHGSSHNYNYKFTETFNSFYIISAGENNQYRHPHSEVIKDLLFKGYHPFIVTENKGSSVHFKINY